MTRACPSSALPSVDSIRQRVAWSHRIREALLDTFAPRGCLACDAELHPGRERLFCAPCAIAVESGEPWAPYLYGGAIRHAIVRLKFQDRTDLAEPLGRRLGAWAFGRGAIPAGALVVPVASSPERIRERGYCHATLVARGVASELGLTLVPFGLTRLRQDGTQLGRGREDRLSALRDAYVASEKVRGKRVLLVDDVRTTGATLDACTLALTRAGAAHVEPLVVAWTPPENET